MKMISPMGSGKPMSFIGFRMKKMAYQRIFFMLSPFCLPFCLLH